MVRFKIVLVTNRILLYNLPPLHPMYCTPCVVSCRGCDWRPLRWEVWIAVAGVLAGAGPFLWFLARFCRGAHLPRVLWFRKIGNCVLFIIQPMLQVRNCKIQVRTYKVQVGCI